MRRARLQLVCLVTSVLTGVWTLPGCATNSTSDTTVQTTEITVSPSRFAQGLLCGSMPGAFQKYVATLIDVTDPAHPFRLASSQPVPCAMSVSFVFVVPGHLYTAEIEGYDRSDITPWGGPSSGSPHMVDTQAGQDVAPRWKSYCGMTPPGTSSPADADAGADAAPTGPQPTMSLSTTNVWIKDCSQFEELTPPGPASLVLDLSQVHPGLSCGEQPGQLWHLRVLPTDSSLSPVQADCDQKLTFEPVTAQVTYRFRLEGYEQGSSTVRWASECQGKAQAGVQLPIRCEPLSDQGAIQLDVSALLDQAGHHCGSDDIVTYQAVLVGSGLIPEQKACASDTTFSPLSPGAYQVLVDGFDATGARKLSSYCEASVSPAQTTLARCQSAPTAQ